MELIPNPPSVTEPPPQPHILSPCSSVRTSSSTNSPEFEFWKVRNPSLPQPEILSADQLFLDGVLLPLHHLSFRHSEEPPPHTSDPDPPPSPPSLRPSKPEPNSNSNLKSNDSPLIVSDSTTTSNSKRWIDIFKRSEKKDRDDKDSKLETEKESSSNNNGSKKKSEKRNTSSSSSSSAELNINIWPFSRSRSAGTGVTRPRLGFGSSGSSTRKASSAPCSRSNSSGDSKSRKWPSSPSRPGVHLGRTTPVWKLRRGSPAVHKGGYEAVTGISSEKGIVKKEFPDNHRSKTGSGGGSSGATPKAKVLNLSVPVCIGYRHHLSCRSDGNGDVFVAENRSSGGGGVGGGGVVSSNINTSSGGGNSGNYFNFRSLFTKKVH